VQVVVAMAIWGLLDGSLVSQGEITIKIVTTSLCKCAGWAEEFTFTVLRLASIRLIRAVTSEARSHYRFLTAVLS
jgi:hypothetical protein